MAPRATAPSRSLAARVTANRGIDVKVVLRHEDLVVVEAVRLVRLARAAGEREGLRAEPPRVLEPRWG
jgi:hypothetical protein